MLQLPNYTADEMIFNYLIGGLRDPRGHFTYATRVSIMKADIIWRVHTTTRKLPKGVTALATENGFPVNKGQ